MCCVRRSSRNLDNSLFSEIASSLYLGVDGERVKKWFPYVKYLLGQYNTLSWAAVCPRPAALADLYACIYQKPEDLMQYYYYATKFTSGGTDPRLPVRLETIFLFHSYPTISEGQPKFLTGIENLLTQEQSDSCLKLAVHCNLLPTLKHQIIPPFRYAPTGALRVSTRRN
jgi:hypothetical protein